MKRWIGLALAVLAASLLLWLATRQPAAPAVPFARIGQETLVSVLSTNGRTEPAVWVPVRAAQAGRVRKVLVERGAKVAAGAVLLLMEDIGAKSALAAAEARVDAARAELRALERGGRLAEIAQIDGAVSKLGLELEAARREAAVLERLLQKGAAARAELERAKDRVAELEAERKAQLARRAVLVSDTDLEVARARLREAETAMAEARRRLEDCMIRAPREGTLYELSVREGDWVEAGSLIARIGEIYRLKTLIFVDEPELGRVRVGLPVEITWDALPGRRWQAKVERMPAQVTPLGTRMVGEVWAMCENPGEDLPPGANVNVRIRSHLVENAVTIPKAALRKQGDELGTFVLEGNRLAWRRVEIGATSDVKAEVRSGLRVGEAVALPVDRPLRAGLEVRPVFGDAGN